MLAAQICRELRFGVIASRMQSSRVPRCLFGPANPRDTIDLLQEALEMERARFAKRWGVDPLAEDEDKENNAASRSVPGASPPRARTSPAAKKRASPYAKQTSIHDYWRSRKICDISKKSSSAFVEVTSKAASQQPQLPQAQTSQQQQQQSSFITDKNQPSTI